MSRKERGSEAPDIIGSPAALPRAARRAREIGIQAGTPVYVIKRGRIVNILAQHKATRRRT